ncbi:MAG: carboxyl transferase domain-containing protein, partial [Myxococcota bacterium]|nr:carboxyl transferase domain-containing protein [Myxococcota bacterium]
ACERIIRMSGRVSEDLPHLAILTEEAAQNHGFLSTYADVVVVQNSSAQEEGSDIGQIVKPTLDGVMKQARALLELIPSTRSELKDTLTFSYDGGDREISKEVFEALNRPGPYDVNLLIESIVDRGSFIEFDQARGQAIVTGVATLVNQTIGICASQTLTAAPIGDDALRKITEITRFCERFSIPLINLVDTTDETTQQTLLGGKEYRAVGNFSMSVRHGSEVFAARQMMSPCVSLVVRRCYGSGYLLTTSMRPHHVILALKNAQFSRYDSELTAERAYSDGWVKKVIEPGQIIEQLVHWVRWSRSKRARVTDQLHKNDPMRYNLNLDKLSE